MIMPYNDNNNKKNAGGNSGILSNVLSYGADYGLGLISSAISNDFNRNMMKEQQDFAREMWNKTNEYNDPKNVFKRMREAGLNPYGQFYGNGGLASATSPAGAPSAAPISRDSSLLGAASDKLFNLSSMESQIRLSNAQAENMEINNSTQAALNNAKLREIRANADSKEQEAEINRSIAKNKDAMINSEIGVNESSTVRNMTHSYFLEQQVKAQELANQESYYRLKFLPKRVSLEFALLASDIALKKISATEAGQRYFNLQKQYDILVNDRDLQSSTQQYLIDASRYDRDYKKELAEYMRNNKYPRDARQNRGASGLGFIDDIKDSYDPVVDGVKSVVPWMKYSSFLKGRSTWR